MNLGKKKYRQSKNLVYRGCPWRNGHYSNRRKLFILMNMWPIPRNSYFKLYFLVINISLSIVRIIKIVIHFVDFITFSTIVFKYFSVRMIILEIIQYECVQRHKYITFVWTIYILLVLERKAVESLHWYYFILCNFYCRELINFGHISVKSWRMVVKLKFGI